MSRLNNINKEDRIMQSLDFLVPFVLSADASSAGSSHSLVHTNTGGNVRPSKEELLKKVRALPHYETKIPVSDPEELELKKIRKSKSAMAVSQTMSNLSPLRRTFSTPIPGARSTLMPIQEEDEETWISRPRPPLHRLNSFP